MSENSLHEHVVTQSSSRAAGEIVERHRHTDDQLIYVSRGVIAVATDAGGWVASSNRAVWIPAETWHQHRFHGSSRFHTVGFAAVERVLDADGPAVISVTPLVRELVIAVATDALGLAELSRIRAVLRDQLRRVPQEPVSLPAPRDDRLARACDLVLADLSVPRPLSELAAVAGAGERTLARLFRDEMGMTYPQWRTNIRVYQAMIALAEGRSITATAHDCGWATPSAFISAFRQVTGRTPRAYQIETVPVRS
ncbi:helix-turn-helix transcriptional regulator [uncultured Gordonia sp.]|uniref:AraC family transcriptional regulator n=1 Tax=uncultured Gordonia sp. TaxID=198437 RepID=UPI00258DA21E|nr:helix-turn-helix transcriptional regulator [uncultured Gordonia sp.]